MTVPTMNATLAKSPFVAIRGNGLFPFIFVCPDARDWALHLSGAKGGIKATAPAPLLGRAVSATTPEPLRLHPDNPHYFLWKGKPTVRDVYPPWRHQNFRLADLFRGHGVAHKFG